MKIKMFILLGLLLLSLKVETKAQTTLNAPLSLRIEAKVLSAPCAKRVLDIKATITNTSKQEIVIDINSIPYHYSLTYIDAMGKGGGEYSASGGGSSGGGKYTGNYLILKPKKSYNSKQIIEEQSSFKIDRDVKFYVSVQYEQLLKDSFKGIEVWKGTVQSNSSEFKFKPCQKKTAQD